MADALAQAKKPEEARLAYDQFLSYFPESELRPTVQFRVGLSDFTAKDFARAAVAFTATLEDSTTAEVTSAARYNLALCHRMLGQADSARAGLERYRDAYPNDARAADVAYQLGDLDEAAGQTQDAVREYAAALEKHPAPGLATELGFRLGRCRERLGDKDGALRAYQLAAGTGTRDDSFRLSAVARCAALYEAKHEYTRAIAAYRDLMRNASDKELVAAASDRATQLEASVHHP